VRWKTRTADVLAYDKDGFPVILVQKYGQGQLIFVNSALEFNAFTHGNEFYKVYRKLAQLAGVDVPEKSPEIGITTHKTADGKTLKFFINYADHEVDGMPGNSVKYEIL
jgi:hypothetical protein